MANAIIDIDSDELFDSQLQRVPNKLVVVDFFAVWCGPCKAIAPKYTQLALQYPSVAFFKVDVDKCQGTGQRYNISSMPTFVFIYQNEVKAKISGADPVALENKIKDLVKTYGNLSNEKSAVPGMVDLDSYIIEKNCLNESEEHPVKYVFEDNESLYLESDCDPELLVSLSFNQNIKLHSMKCVGPPDGHAPKTIRLFINQPNAMDFDSARDATPLQEVTLGEKEVSTGEPIPLKYVKLQNVNNITLFFADNQGDEETTIVQRIVFYGKSVSTTNMEEFKRVAGKKGESH